MKLNISCAETGQVKSIEVEEDKLLLPFYEKRIGAEVPADTLGEEWKGYILRVTGGNDKQGFPMMQGVLVNHRVRLLLRKGMKCFRERRKGSARRKSVRGCIVASDISALNLLVSRKGENEIAGLTDEVRPVRHGPKRASKIRKMFGLSKEDDVRKFVVRRVTREAANGKPAQTKSPKIQRLVTPQRLHRKKTLLAEHARRKEAAKQAAAEYKKMIREYKIANKKPVAVKKSAPKKRSAPPA